MENKEDINNDGQLKIVGVSPISYFSPTKGGLSNFKKNLSRFFLVLYEDGQVGVYNMGGKPIKRFRSNEYTMELKKSLRITEYIELTIDGKKWNLAPDPSFTWGAAKSLVVSGALRHSEHAGDRAVGGLIEGALLVSSMNGQIKGFYNKLAEYKDHKASNLKIADFSRKEDMPPEIKALRKKFKNKLDMIIVFGVLIFILGFNLLRLYLSGEAEANDVASLTLVMAISLLTLSIGGLYMAFVQRSQF